MKKDGAFTLIEMLMVLVLMGLILTIGLPAVVRIVANKANEQYDAQIKLVEKATQLYTLRYQGDFKEFRDSGCFLLDYNVLKEEGLINEDNVICEGNIILTPKNGNTYKQDYYLKCTDKSNNRIIEDVTDQYPANNSCLNVRNLGEKDDTEVKAPTITGGRKEWGTSNVTITVSNSGEPTNDIQRYEYYTSTTSKTPAKYVTPTGTKTVSNNSLQISTNGTTYVWYRVVKKNGDISKWSNRQEANIDNTAPTGKPLITASDGIVTGVAHRNPFTLAISSDDANISESGNVYYYTKVNSSTSVTLNNINTELPSSTLYIPITAADNGKTIYVKACNAVGKCPTSGTANIASYKVVFSN